MLGSLVSLLGKCQRTESSSVLRVWVFKEDLIWRENTDWVSFDLEKRPGEQLWIKLPRGEV